MRAALTAFACAAALAVPAAPSGATSFGTADGYGTVTPGFGTTVPTEMRWEMDLRGREGGCWLVVVENAGNAAGGFGTGILDCGGTMYGYGVCTATRVGMTMTLACPNHSFGGGVVQIFPGIAQGDEGAASAFTLRAATAFAL